jgi:hypothetical protein
MGYYDGSFKRVVICCDHIKNKQELEDTLVHELTHAFDSLRKGRFKSICHLIACGEIRASALGRWINYISRFLIQLNNPYLKHDRTMCWNQGYK